MCASTCAASPCCAEYKTASLRVGGRMRNQGVVQARFWQVFRHRTGTAKRTGPDPAAYLWYADKPEYISAFKATRIVGLLATTALSLPQIGPQSWQARLSSIASPGVSCREGLLVAPVGARKARPRAAPPTLVLASSLRR